MRLPAAAAAVVAVAVTAACGAAASIPAPAAWAPAPTAAAPAASMDESVTDPVSARVVDGAIPVAPATADSLNPPPDPARLRLGRLGIDMEVAGVGIDTGGGMELPDSAGVAGWFRLGGNPGGGPRVAQNAVIAAHVDDAVIGRGPFARLREARAGDVVEVILEDGAAATYVVDRVEQTSKREVDFSVVFGSQAGALVLVTCGGRWDADVGHYDDNVLVWALPEDAG